jgi:cysteinyl-tRNA synthetase
LYPSFTVLREPIVIASLSNNLVKMVDCHSLKRKPENLMTQTEPLLLFNTLKREKQVFIPQDPDRVTLYACGPTVYNYAHIGNARPAVIFDLLFRLLSSRYPRVIYARNITDVDDKINAAAAEQNVPIEVISKRYSDAYHTDMAALGVGLPTIEPRATQHIGQMIDMIKRLVNSGHAYEADGHVFFSVESFSDYGSLSGRDFSDMLAGARVEVSESKRHPGDFVLWKPSEDPLPGWDSPWGWGRPGWHLECSVMSEQHLGETIDIHGGGQDLVFPHHENEIAQSVCAHGGKTFARYWMHNGFVTVNKRKMSKSLGNTLVVHELLKQTRGEVLRYLLLSAHYRQPLDWSEETLARVQRTVDRVYGVLRDANEKYGELKAAESPSEEFMSALLDDLNTPDALAVINSEAKQLANADNAETARATGGRLLAANALIGLFQEDPREWLAGDTEGLDDALIEQLIEERNTARSDKNFARADEIRDQLQSMGIGLEDVAGGTRWHRSND